jgi:hypothetical protein
VFTEPLFGNASQYFKILTLGYYFAKACALLLPVPHIYYLFLEDFIDGRVYDRRLASFPIGF